MMFKFNVGQKVRFGSTANAWAIVSRDWASNAHQPQYFLETADKFPKYHQYVLESDLREVLPNLQEKN